MTFPSKASGEPVGAETPREVSAVGGGHSGQWPSPSPGLSRSDGASVITELPTPGPCGVHEP